MKAFAARHLVQICANERSRKTPYMQAIVRNGRVLREDAEGAERGRHMRHDDRFNTADRFILCGVSYWEAGGPNPTALAKAAVACSAGFSPSVASRAVLDCTMSCACQGGGNSQLSEGQVGLCEHGRVNSLISLSALRPCSAPVHKESGTGIFSKVSASREGLRMKMHLVRCVWAGSTRAVSRTDLATVLRTLQSGRHIPSGCNWLLSPRMSCGLTPSDVL